MNHALQKGKTQLFQKQSHERREPASRITLFFFLRSKSMNDPQSYIYVAPIFLYICMSTSHSRLCTFC
jgi:hypothetical protein